MNFVTLSMARPDCRVQVPQLASRFQAQDEAGAGQAIRKDAGKAYIYGVQQDKVT